MKLLPNGGEPLVYPEGTEKAGEPIKALKDGTPDRGIVFFNGADGSWQVVRGNGKETILITGVEPEQALLLQAKKEALCRETASLTLEASESYLVTQELNLVSSMFKIRKKQRLRKRWL